MFYLVLTIHIVLCLLIIGLVMLQQGKGAQVGAILSGSSNTLFGAAGASTTLARFTTWLAIAFFITSVALIKIRPSDSLGTARVTTGQAGGGLEGSILGEMVKKSASSNVEEAASAAPVAVPAAPAPAVQPPVVPENAASTGAKKP